MVINDKDSTMRSWTKGNDKLKGKNQNGFSVIIEIS